MYLYEDLTVPRAHVWVRFESEKEREDALKSVTNFRPFMGSRPLQITSHSEASFSAAVNPEMTCFDKGMRSRQWPQPRLVLAENIEAKVTLRDLMEFLYGYDTLAKPIWFLNQGSKKETNPSAPPVRKMLFKMASTEEAHRLVRERNSSPLLRRRVRLKVL